MSYYIYIYIIYNLIRLRFFGFCTQMKFNLEFNWIWTPNEIQFRIQLNLIFQFLHSIIHLKHKLKIKWGTWCTIGLQLKFNLDSNLIFFELWLLIYIDDSMHLNCFSILKFSYFILVEHNIEHKKWYQEFVLEYKI